MERIEELMELCGTNYIKKFLKVFLIFFLLSTLVSYDWFHYDAIGIRVEVDGSMAWWLPYIFIFVLIWMHYRRFHHVLEEGSFNRIRLLPIPKMSIVYSELCYVTATFLGMMVCISLGYLAGYFLASGGGVHELFYSLANNEATALYLPMTVIDLVKSILFVFTLSYVTVLFLLSFSDQDISSTTKVILVVLLLLFLLINYMGATNRYSNHARFSYFQISVIKSIEMLILIGFAQYRLYKYFGRKEKNS